MDCIVWEGVGEEKGKKVMEVCWEVVERKLGAEEAMDIYEEEFASRNAVGDWELLHP